MADTDDIEVLKESIKKDSTKEISEEKKPSAITRISRAVKKAKSQTKEKIVGGLEEKISSISRPETKEEKEERVQRTKDERKFKFEEKQRLKTERQEDIRTANKQRAKQSGEYIHAVKMGRLRSSQKTPIRETDPVGSFGGSTFGFGGEQTHIRTPRTSGVRKVRQEPVDLIGNIATPGGINVSLGGVPSARKVKKQRVVYETLINPVGDFVFSNQQKSQKKTKVIKQKPQKEPDFFGGNMNIRSSNPLGNMNFGSGISPIDTERKKNKKSKKTNSGLGVEIFGVI